MAHLERSLHVSFSGRPRPLLLQYIAYLNLTLAGNSSLLLIMNGASFEDVAPTAGRYGYVAICVSL